MSLPLWLPHTVSVDGQWEKVLKMLYRIFEDDFIDTIPCLKGCEVLIDDRVIDEEYEESFWHLITRRDHQSGERLLDPRRAEHLPWCAPTINHCSDPAVKMWDHRESSNRLRTYVWLEHWDYVVILEKRKQRRGEVAILVTAYHVDGQSTRRKMQKKFENREY
jgi:hypothetical protein